MSHSAILVWIGQLVHVPEGTTFKDLSDGRILTCLLHKLNPEIFPQCCNSSPQKNFQMDILCVTNLVGSLKQNIQHIPEINCLLIAKHQDVTEIVKLIAVIIKIMIESQIAQEAILKLNEEQVQNILQFVNQFQEDDASSDRRLLDKIDELEDENHKLRNLLEEYDLQAEKQKQKLKQSETIIVQKENEITELKQSIIFKQIGIQKFEHPPEDISGTVIEKLKMQLNQLNKDKKELQELNTILEQKCKQYYNLEQTNAQLQQELCQRYKQDKIIDELKTNIEIMRQQMEVKDQKIIKLSDQVKQNTQNQQKECGKVLELEMINEQLKQELEDIQRNKNKEIHQLQQSLSEMMIQVENLQTERQDTQRSSARYQQSPRCLESEFKCLVADNIGGYYSESAMMEMQQQLQHKDQILNQKEVLFEQKVKTLEAKINREKDINIQHLQITSQLQDENRKLKQEMDKLSDTNYQINRIQSEKQQNMLLVSVIESLNERINQLCLQQKEQLKTEKKMQPLIRNSLWSAKQ